MMSRVESRKKAKSKGLEVVEIRETGVVHPKGPGWMRKVILTSGNEIGEGKIFDCANTASGKNLWHGVGQCNLSVNFDWPSKGVLFKNGLYGVCSRGTVTIQVYFEMHDD